PLPLAAQEQEGDHPTRSSIRKSVPNARNVQQLEESGSRPVDPFLSFESHSASSAVTHPHSSNLLHQNASKPFLDRTSHSPPRIILDVRPKRKREITKFLRTFN